MLKSPLNLLEKLISRHQEQFYFSPDYILFGKIAIFSFLEELHQRDRNHWLEKKFRYKGMQIILVDAQLQVRNWQYVGYNCLRPVDEQGHPLAQQVASPDYSSGETSTKGITYSDQLIATATYHHIDSETNHLTGLTIQHSGITTFTNAITKNQLYTTVSNKTIVKLG